MPPDSNFDLQVPTSFHRNPTCVDLRIIQQRIATLLPPALDLLPAQSDQCDNTTTPNKPPPDVSATDSTPQLHVSHQRESTFAARKAPRASCDWHSSLKRVSADHEEIRKEARPALETCTYKATRWHAMSPLLSPVNPILSCAAEKRNLEKTDGFRSPFVPRLSDHRKVVQTSSRKAQSPTICNGVDSGQCPLQEAPTSVSGCQSG